MKTNCVATEVDTSKLLVECFDLSRSEAKRLIKEGAVYIDIDNVSYKRSFWVGIKSYLSTLVWETKRLFKNKPYIVCTGKREFYSAYIRPFGNKLIIELDK